MQYVQNLHILLWTEKYTKPPTTTSTPSSPSATGCRCGPTTLAEAQQYAWETAAGARHMGPGELWRGAHAEVGRRGFARRLVYRHPFPGPGLGVRILDLLRRADDIFIKGLRKHDLYDKTSQAFAVILSVRSAGLVSVGLITGPSGRLCRKANPRPSEWRTTSRRSRQCEMFQSSHP